MSYALYEGRPTGFVLVNEWLAQRSVMGIRP